MNEKNNYAVTLAGLLHDIGKFEWRATPLRAGGDHETYSEQIFNEFISLKPCLAEFRDEIGKLIKHHGNHILSAVKKADQTDAAANRQAEEDTNARRPLISIASRVELLDPAPEKVHYYMPQELNIDKVFPIPHEARFSEKWKLDSDEIMKAHAELFVSFTEELKQLPGNSLEGLTDTLLFLYEKYLCYITSAAYRSVPDISLFDHSKTTAALAVCYAAADSEDKEKFLLIAADVSGIQNFIYSDETAESLPAGGKAKRLRGKSFYLSLLTDTFAHYLISQFNVSRANILINGGGHFVLVVPNSVANRELFAQLKERIQSWFYTSFGGALNLMMAYITADDKVYKEFSEWYDKLSSVLMKEKKQKGIASLDKIFNSGSINFDTYDPELFSVVLQDSEDKKERSDYRKLENRYEMYMYMQAKMFERIGEDLPKTNYLIEIHARSRDAFKYDESRERVLIRFAGFGIYWALIEDERRIEAFLKENENADIDLVRIVRINDTNFMPPRETFFKATKYPVSFGFRVMGNHAPPNKRNEVMEFRELSEQNHTNGVDVKLKYPLLGVLRMDVDNLGTIFSQGLKGSDESDRRLESIESLARVVNLSREMNLFFQGYLNALAEKWSMYITYSGGDDLFVVGSWINALHFAMDVRKDFNRFVCGNKNVTLSGGLFLCKDHFPIGRSAQQAGELEDEAKNRFADKNCLSLFGRSLKWNQIEELLSYAGELDQVVNEKDKDSGLSRGYVHFLLTQIEDIYKKPGKDGPVTDIEKYYRKLALIKYSLARSPRNITKEKMEGADGRKPTKHKVMARLINDTAHENFMENFIVPASYVILKNREAKG